MDLVRGIPSLELIEVLRKRGLTPEDRAALQSVPEVRSEANPSSLTEQRPAVASEPKVQERTRHRT